MHPIIIDAATQAAASVLFYFLIFAFVLTFVIGLHYYIKWRIKRAVRAATEALMSAPRAAASLAVSSVRNGASAVAQNAQYAAVQGVSLASDLARSSTLLLDEKCAPTARLLRQRIYSSVQPIAANAGSRAVSNHAEP